MASNDSDSDLELEIEGDEAGTGAKTLLVDIKTHKLQAADAEQPHTQKKQAQLIKQAQEEIDKTFGEYEIVMPYACKLILEDIGNSEDKQVTNKSYYIQVLQHKSEEVGLLCKWVNTGGHLDFSYDKAESLDEAISQFKDKFFEIYTQDGVCLRKPSTTGTKERSSSHSPVLTSGLDGTRTV